MAIYNGGLNIIAQDISGKEDKSNKVTAWSSTTTDTNYPSEKLVKDALDGKAEKSEIEASVTTNSLTAGAIIARDGDANIGSLDTKFGNLFVNYINQMEASRYVFVNWDGVMEIGNYIDFHKSGNPRDDEDYTCRISISSDNKLSVDKGIYGAIFNDLADAIPVGEGDVLEAGYCYGFDGEHYTKTSDYMQKSYIGIHSDTFGFKMGHEEGKEKLNVAVSGFVLAYVDREYEVGTPLTCTTDGYLTEIKFEDKIKYPERIVATYWKNEPNEEWGPERDKIKVNGRKWVKVK